MKPTTGEDALSTQPSTLRRKSTTVQRPPTSSGPQNFSLKTEKELDESTTSSASTSVQDSNYGVQSLEDTLHEAFGDERNLHGTAEDVQESRTSPVSVDRSKSRSPISIRQSPSSRAGHSKKDLKLSPNLHDTLTRAGSQHRKTSSSITQKYIEPISLDSPAPGTSFANTPRSLSIQSFKLSDDGSAHDDASSQAIMSSDEEEEPTASKGMTDAAALPQLVMPSIQIPQRRPFTARGKQMGRLRIMVVGTTEVGKTSLIQSILHLCDDIVHVDPSTSTPSAALPSKLPVRSTSKGKTAREPILDDITEIHASTKAYPSWWNDSEEGQSRLRRRKSMGETVLERNLCFIDTPGIAKESADTTIDQIIQYVEASYRRNCAIGIMSSSEQLALMSGSGGIQVDVILFLFSDTLDNAHEVDAFKRLSAIANVVPVISRSDSLAPGSIVAIKKSLLSHFYLGGIQPFLFGKSVEDLSKQLAELAKEQACRSNELSEITPEAVQAQDESRLDPEGRDVESTRLLDPLLPFAVSSKPSDDSETMDASLLMSSGYVQPLVRSDLPALVAKLFDPENMAWLRHSSAKRFMQWRSKAQIPAETSFLDARNFPLATPRANGTFNFGTTFTTPQTAAISTASSLLSSPSPSQVLVPHKHSPFYSLSGSPSGSDAGLSNNSPMPLSPQAHPQTALTRFNEHTQREERLAEVRLAKWATDLQRSLRNERERFEQLERTKRTQWLLERMNEEVRDGQILPALTNGTSSPPPEVQWAMIRHGSAAEKSRYLSWEEVRATVDPRDPLGLAEWNEKIKRGGIILLTAGVLGVACFAVVSVSGKGVLGWVEGEGAWWG